jgi:hypothetical protein
LQQEEPPVHPCRLEHPLLDQTAVMVAIQHLAQLQQPMVVLAVSQLKEINKRPPSQGQVLATLFLLATLDKAEQTAPRKQQE